MNITIDTGLVFLLPRDRKVTLDVLDLQEFVDALWETKGKAPTDKDGKEIKGPDGADLPRSLDWGTIQDEMKSFVKAKTEVEIAKSEALAIWGAVTKRDADGKTVLEKKRDAWLAPEVEPLDSPNSPSNTDHLFAND